MKLTAVYRHFECKTCWQSHIKFLSLYIYLYFNINISYYKLYLFYLTKFIKVVLICENYLDEQNV